MKLHLVDKNPAVAKALAEAFAPHADVDVRNGDLLEVAFGAVVSPANSYGFMDGGIDAVYAAFFGPRLVRLVRDTVLAEPDGLLPVGSAVAVPTGNERIPFLLVAPTMLMPEPVPAQNAYRALRAALRLMSRTQSLGEHLFSPGLTTLVGAVEPQAAAHEMAQAYADWKNAQASHEPP